MQSKVSDRFNGDGARTASPGPAGALPAELRERLDSSWSSLQDAMLEYQLQQERVIMQLVEQSVDSETPLDQKKSEPASRNVAPAESFRICDDDFVHNIISTLERDKTDLEIDLGEMLTDFDNHGSSCFQECRRRALSSMAWCLSLREPKRKGPLATLLYSNFWTAVVDGTILLNAIVMVISTNSVAEHISEKDWKLPKAISSLDFFFLIFFTIEWLLRIAVHRLYFFCNSDFRWNWFDTFLVLQSLQDAVVAFFVSQDSSVNVLFLRALRVLRLARTLRLIRVLRFASPLRRMLESVLGSFASLFWSFVMLAFVFFLFAIAIVQSVNSSISAEDFAGVDSDAAELMEYFGSIQRAMLTLYMATSGGNDWSMYYELLSKKAIFASAMFIFVISFTQIALLNVLTGLFVESAMKVSMPDDEARALEQRRADMKDLAKFRRCLKSLDINCSGTITWDEFSKISTDPRVHSMFSVMGLELSDAMLFFDMVSKQSQTDEIDFDFLLEACLKMRGPAMSVDVQSMIYRMQFLSERVDRLLKSHHPSSAAGLEQPAETRLTLADTSSKSEHPSSVACLEQPADQRLTLAGPPSTSDASETMRL